MSKRVFTIFSDGKCSEGCGKRIKLDERGVQIANEIAAAIDAEKVKDMASDTVRRDKYRKCGETTWSHICATFDALQDIPFKYTTSTYTDNGIVMYVVFDGFTAIAQADSKQTAESVTVSWETQVGAPGWIGDVITFCGRGAAVAEADVPVAVKLAKVFPDEKSITKFFTTMLFLETYDNGFILDYMRKQYQELPPVCPAIRATVNSNNDTILFDGEVVCTRGELPDEKLWLPKYFDTVRNNVRFWCNLYDAVLRGKRC